MDEPTRKFLDTSPIAKRVKLKSSIILHRTRVSPADIVNIRNDKTYEIPPKEAVCELEVGGKVVAKGKIVKKKGESYFKVEEIQ